MRRRSRGDGAEGEGGKAGSRLTHLARIGGGERPCHGLRWMRALGRRVGRRRDGSKSENIGGCIEERSIL